jgi:uncharacterized protein with von Willebrand factor type A (vWA) domain
MAFAQALRAAGFSVAPEQASTLIAAVGLLGPTSLMDIRRAAHATLGPAPERRDEFDALFDEVFLGRTLTAEAFGEPEDMPAAYDAGELEMLLDANEEDPSGADASVAERLFDRRFEADGRDINRHNQFRLTTHFAAGDDKHVRSIQSHRFLIGGTCIACNDSFEFHFFLAGQRLLWLSVAVHGVHSVNHLDRLVIWNFAVGQHG